MYANLYVDLGKVNTVGIDYNYTLVTYTKELLKLINVRGALSILTLSLPGGSIGCHLVRISLN